MFLHNNFVPTQDVDVQEIAGGKYAVTEHVGPYSGLAGVIEYLYGQWLPQNGYKTRLQPGFELYKNDFYTTPPEKLLTEVYIPVK